MVGRSCGGVPRDGDNAEAAVQLGCECVHDFSEAAPHSIAVVRAAHFSGGHETGGGCGRCRLGFGLYALNVHNEPFAGSGTSLCADFAKEAGSAEAYEPTFWHGERMGWRHADVKPQVLRDGG